MLFPLLLLFLGEPIWQFDLATVEIYNRPALAVGNDLICIVNAKERQLVFVNPDSGESFSAGRHGDGPGEFQSIYDVQWHAESQQFLVLDPRKSRLSLFSKEGRYVDSFHLPEHFLKFCPGTGNSLIYLKDVSGKKGSAPTVAQLFWSSQEINVLWQMEPLKKAVGIHRADADFKFSVKFEWDPGLVLGGNGKTSVFNYSQNFSAKVLRPGQPIQTFDFEIQRILFQDEDVDLRFTGPSAAFRQKLEPFFDLPEVWPTLGQIFVDNDLVWLISPSPERMLGAYFAVYGFDGIQTQSGSMPFKPKVIQDGFVYWIATDEAENLTLQKVDVKNL